MLWRHGPFITEERVGRYVSEGLTLEGRTAVQNPVKALQWFAKIEATLVGDPHRHAINIRDINKVDLRLKVHRRTTADRETAQYNDVQASRSEENMFTKGEFDSMIQKLLDKACKVPRAQYFSKVCHEALMFRCMLMTN